VLDVRPIARRQDDLRDSLAPGGDHLALDPAHRQDPAAQSDLTRERHPRPGRPIDEQREQRNRDHDPGRRTILGSCPRRDVDVQIVEAERLTRDTIVATVGAQPAQRSVRRLFHDLLDVTRDPELSAIASHPCRFHEKDLTSGGSPGQRDRHPRRTRPLLQLGANLELVRSEELTDLLGTDA
jgi:hypothetical protein